MDEEKKQKIMYWLAEVAICSHTFIDRPEHPEMKKEYMSRLIGILVDAIFDESDEAIDELISVVDSHGDIMVNNYKAFVESKMKERMKNG